MHRALGVTCVVFVSPAMVSSIAVLTWVFSLSLSLKLKCHFSEKTYPAPGKLSVTVPWVGAGSQSPIRHGWMRPLALVAFEQG